MARAVGAPGSLLLALEIAELTGQKPSDFAPSSGGGPRAAPFDYRMVFLVRPRLQMLRAIDLRCELMVQRGLMMARHRCRPSPFS